jgi:hypothetical protein
VFVAPEKSPATRERIFDCFNPCFKTFKEFDRIMQRCTKDRRQMVMYMHQGSGERICENVFWTLPPPAFSRKFRIPSELRQSNTWKFSKEWGKRAAPPSATAPKQGVLRADIRRPAAAPVTLASVRSLIHARVPPPNHMLSGQRSSVLPQRGRR